MFALIRVRRTEVPGKRLTMNGYISLELFVSLALRIETAHLLTKSTSELFSDELLLYFSLFPSTSPSSLNPPIPFSRSDSCVFELVRAGSRGSAVVTP